MHGQKVVHEDLKEYDYLYSISSNSNNSETGKKEIIRIYSHNIDNLPIYGAKVKKSTNH